MRGVNKIPKNESNQHEVMVQFKQNHLRQLNFDSILIITYGRSGSTLLQGILNAIDGCLIKGENYNAIFHLFEFYEKLILNKQKNSNQTGPNNPFYGAALLDEESVLKHIQNMVRDILLADKVNNPDFFCYGFKEISYIKYPDKLFSYLDFLVRIFPNVGFIFNTRNIEDVIKSAWWANIDPEKAKSDLHKIEELFDEYCENHSNSFQITYEEIVANDQGLKAMFDFIGAEYSRSTVDRILTIPHSYSPTQEHIKKLFQR